MNDMDCQALVGPWPNWDPNSNNFGAACSTTASSLTGSDNAQKIWNYFLAKGLKPYMAAGFLGNMHSEDPPFDPTLLQGGGHSDNVIVDNSTGYGLVQWTSLNRQQGLKDLAAKEGIKSGDLGVQLDYVWQELNGAYLQSTLTPLLASTNVTDATHIIELHYEVHKAPPIQPKRTADAMGYLNLYGSSTPTQTGTAPTPPSDGSAATSAGCGTLAGAVGVDADGYAFPLRTTQTAIKNHQPTWCWQSQTNCHHDYPAADIFTDVGTEVLAARGGTVVVAAETPCDGQIGHNTNVTIQGDDGKFYFYAHMQGALEVKKGDTVKVGQGLGHVGPSPCAQNTDPHVHVQWYTSMITGPSTAMEIQPMLTKAFASLPQ